MVNTCVIFSKAETRAEFAERSVAKLEKTIDDLEGMLHYITFFFFILQWSTVSSLNLLFQTLTFSRFLSLIFDFSSFFSWSAQFCLSLSLSALSTCRRTVHSEAQIQGDQRGAGSVPQWYEHLVNLASSLRYSRFPVLSPRPPASTLSFFSSPFAVTAPCPFCMKLKLNKDIYLFYSVFCHLSSACFSIFTDCYKEVKLVDYREVFLVEFPL